LEPSAPTRIQLCGRLVVVLDGRRFEHALPSRQGRLLFAHMVVHRRRPVSRSQLVEALWPGGAPAAADRALSALLSKLRAALGNELVAGRDRPSLALPGDAYVDLEAAADRLHVAESAVATLDWHRAWAPARAALHTAERGFMTGEEAPWIDEVRHELEDIRLRAHDAVAAVALGLAGPELAAAERSGRALTDAAPFRESGYLHLMRALAAQGNVAEALRVHDRLRCLLRDELGIAPSAAVQTLHRGLLDGGSTGDPANPTTA
jgi:DNA-binding SARP family transcriptional activator